MSGAGEWVVGALTTLGPWVLPGLVAAGIGFASRTRPRLSLAMAMATLGGSMFVAFVMPLFSMVLAFREAAVVSVTDKATVLSAGISEAVNCFALALPFGLAEAALGGWVLYVALARTGRRAADSK